MSSVDEAFLAAQSLPPTEKLQLISRLWETIPPTYSWRPPESDLVEIERRWAEYEAGKVETIPWESVWGEVEREMSGDGQG